ncbi:MAG: hypothetical protein ACYC26_13070 [Phycisphaerales bacterium]
MSSSAETVTCREPAGRKTNRMLPDNTRNDAMGRSCAYPTAGAANPSADIHAVWQRDDISQAAQIVTLIRGAAGDH